MKFSEDKRLKLGEMLVNANLLSREQLKTALEYQKTTGGRLGEIIEKLGFVSEDIMVDFVGRQQGLEIVNLPEMILPDALIKKMPQHLMEKYTFLPVGKKDDILTIAISDPTDYEAIEDIQMFTNLRVEVVLARRSAIKQVLGQVFHKADKAGKSKEELIKDLETKPAAEAAATTAGVSLKTSAEIVNALNGLIKLLVSKNIIKEDELSQKINELKKK